MPNVMMTTICNLKCPYCFGQERIRHAHSPNFSGPEDIEQEISIRNVNIVMEMFKKWRLTRINLMGGEPTLHSRFQQVIELLQANRFLIHVFTNGVIQKRNVDFLSAQEGITYLLNHNHPEFYSLHPSPASLGLIDYFLTKCGKTVSLGINIFKKDFNPDFLIEKIKKFNLKKIIRIAFANPICTIGAHPKNEYLSLDHYRMIIPKLMEFSRVCDKEDICLSFDCGLPLCAFTKEEYGELYYERADFHPAFCHPAIDIGIDLGVWRCFVTSGIHNDKKLTDFTSLREIRDYFDRKFNRFQIIGGMDQCFSCKYMKRNQCQGGCIGHTINKFQRASKGNTH